MLLIIDNAPSHIKLPSTKPRVTALAFLPPNTTNVVQPLYQGIIRCYKVLYQTAMLMELISQLDAGEADPKIDMG